MITLLYIPFCIAFAYFNAWLIKHERRIYHGINGAIHITAATVAAYFTHWYHFFTVLLITRVFFDWSLNLFRGLPLGYVSMKPKSLVDRVEKAIFKLDGISPKIIYIVIITILIII